VSELPPAAIRSPPAKVVANNSSPLIPALSNLTPIPLRELQLQQGTAVNRTGTTLAAGQSLQQPVISTATSTVNGQPPVASVAVSTPAAAAPELISIQVRFYGFTVFVGFFFLVPMSELEPVPGTDTLNTSRTHAELRIRNNLFGFGSKFFLEFGFGRVFEFYRSG
jgi:hypothetical protein